MPWLVALGTTLLGMFADSLKGLVGRVLVSLGFGVVTATGINALMSLALSYANFSGGSANFQAAVQAIGLPWFVSTVLSAITTRMTIRGLTSDSFSFWRMRKQIQ